MLDHHWHGNVGRISPEAPVQVVHIRREESRLLGRKDAGQPRYVAEHDAVLFFVLWQRWSSARPPTKHNRTGSPSWQTGACEF